MHYYVWKYCRSLFIGRIGIFDIQIKALGHKMAIFINLVHFVVFAIDVIPREKIDYKFR